MKRIILFSNPTKKNIKKILNFLFPLEFKQKKLAFMPSNGANCPKKYLRTWKNYAKTEQTEFQFINNATNNSNKEKERLLNSNILLITGGNTFRLLNNLKKSGLDKTIKKFTQKENYIIAGFSAGAIVLSPSIKICNIPSYDKNLDNIKNFNGLNLVPFEIFPHYSNKWKKSLNDYRNFTKNQVRTIKENGYIILKL